MDVPAPRRFPARGLLLGALAATTGFTILGLEFAAIRWLAPAFGQSPAVWSGVLALVLLALAVGYGLGSRWTRRGEGLACLAKAHGAAALWLGVVLLQGTTLRDALIPTGIPEERGLSIAFGGSLLATAIHFVVPLVLASATSPFLVQALARRGNEGVVAGRLFAVGTLGSLLACIVVPLYALPYLGTRAVLLASMLSLAVSGVVLAGLGRRAAREVEAGPASEPSKAAAGRVPILLLVASALAGCVITTAEFAGVRFMAPWFGQSGPVWANVIGVVMGAMALGAYRGGQLAEREGGGAALTLRALFAGAWLFVVVTAFGRPLLNGLMPAGIGSLDVGRVSWGGSIVGAAVLLGPPTYWLSMVGPALVARGARDTTPGHVAGLVLAWNTVGGILGCVVAPLFVIPAIGSAKTLMLGAALAVLVTWVLGRLGGPRGERVGAPGAALGAVGLAALLGLALDHRPLRSHPGQVVEIESAIQTVRVVESESLWSWPPRTPAAAQYVARGTLRYLRHDEDAETYQSAWLRIPENRELLRAIDAEEPGVPTQLPDTPDGLALTGGMYFEHLALGTHMVARPPSRPLRVLIVGFAAGTVARVLYDGAPDGVGLDVLGIEIDPGVVDIAREHLDLRSIEARFASGDQRPGSRLRIVAGEDARTVVNALPEDERFDVILVDAYARTNYLPFQLASVEFFRRARSHLADGGVVGVNVLGTGLRSPVVRSVARTIHAAFGGCRLAPNPDYPSNLLLWARRTKGEPGAGGGALRVGARQPSTRLLRRAAWSFDHLGMLYDPDAETDPRVRVLTDDRSATDRLADEELGL